MGGGKGGSSRGSSTVTQNADPWAGVQPYLTQQFSQAQNLYNTGKLTPEAFPSQTYANFTPEQNQALQLQIGRATNGSPINRTAQGYEQGLLSGDYLNNNPYLDKAFNKAADQVQSRTMSAFESGGRSGSGLNQRVLGQNLDDLATNIYGGAYNDERNRQQQGLLFAPQLANQDYYDIGQLQNAGAQLQGQNQNAINEAMDRFNLEHQAPTTALQTYQGLTGGGGVGNYGSKTESTPYYQNNTANTLGLLGSLSNFGQGGLLGGIGSAVTGIGSFNPSSFAKGLPWSDSRLKHDIKLVDSIEGVNLYSFRYNNDPDKVYVGVMAQEILKSHPEAVYIQNGWLAVDYSTLPVPFQRVH